MTARQRDCTICPLTDFVRTNLRATAAAGAASDRRKETREKQVRLELRVVAVLPPLPPPPPPSPRQRRRRALCAEPTTAPRFISHKLAAATPLLCFECVRFPIERQIAPLPLPAPIVVGRPAGRLICSCGQLGGGSRRNYAKEQQTAPKQAPLGQPEADRQPHPTGRRVT